MIISLINRSHSLSDAEILPAVRAINRQIKEDFEPYWSLTATLRLEGAIGSKPDKANLADMRGDAVIYLADKADVANALGYHEANFRGIPYGFVFIELCEQLKENWTVTLSHEALELLGDAQGNLLVQGPHPANPHKTVFHWFEMCDAVQSETYKIDGVEVSNFVLPLYFTPEEQEGGRNDFLGTLHAGRGLHSFGVNPGGYIGFYDPQTAQHDTYTAPADKNAALRARIKSKYVAGRGQIRKHGKATRSKEDSQRRAMRMQQLEANGDPIRHVVVLMLENRSFDHMLGDAKKVHANLEGIPHSGINSNSYKGKTYPQQAGAALSGLDDLPHEHTEVLRQLGVNPPSAPMSGFVSEYAQVLVAAGKPVELAQEAMNYFEFGTLPALHTLAKNFLVCDHWFSSMPGPTWQNRFFIHSGTCLGHVLMPTRKNPASYFYLYNQDTIYDRMNDAGNVEWRIYHDGVPQSTVLSHMWSKYGFSWLTDSYSSMKEFHADAAGNEADFPEYSFIEPNYGFFGQKGNDQHPPSDIADGERLIAEVYNALRNNEELWKSTLLIVTYDEHGGFFDHVVPPKTVAPDNNTEEYAFNQLGVRVPTILVSPWLDAGVCSTVFDHTSVLRYVCDKWNMQPLGNRAEKANSFASELSKRTAPRSDAPSAISSLATPKNIRKSVNADTPLEGAHEAMALFLASLSEDGTEAVLRATRASKERSKTGWEKMSDKKLRALAEQRLNSLLSTQPAQKIANNKKPRKTKRSSLKVNKK